MADDQQGQVVPQNQPQQDQLINVIDPDTQEIGSIPVSQFQQAQSLGYQKASDDQAKDFVKQKTYGTTGQQIITGLEGAGEAATFGVSPGIERALGVSPEAMQARREVNPKSHMLGQVAGLAGSELIPGLGEANLLRRAGEGAVELAGFGQATTTLSKIGSGAVKNAVETAILGGSDEVAKAFISDPNQTLGSAIANVGINGLVGGGIGAAIGSVNPLWKITEGAKVGGYLNKIQNRFNGVDGVTSDPVNGLLDTMGVPVPPEIRATLSDDIKLRRIAKTLEQSQASGSSAEYQETLKNFKSAIQDKVVESLGADPANIKVDINKYDAGNSLAEKISSKFDELKKPITEPMEAWDKRFSGVNLPEDKTSFVEDSGGHYGTVERVPVVEHGTTSKLSEAVANLATKEGWTSSQSSDAMKLVNQVLKELPDQKTVGDLKSFISRVGENANSMDSSPFKNGPATRAGGLIKSELRKGYSQVLGEQVGSEEGVHAFEKYRELSTEYSKLADIKDSIDSSLNIKGSVSGFGKNLREAAKIDGEGIFNKLTSNRDAYLLEAIQTHFPEAAQELRQAYLDRVLSQAKKFAAPGENINSSRIIKEIENMSPQVRDFALSPEALQKVKGMDQLFDEFKKYDKSLQNWSNTSPVGQMLNKYGLTSLVGAGTLIATHSPAAAGFMSGMTKLFSQNIPDAVRLGILKFLGSDKPINTEGLKAVIDFAQHVIKGENTIGKVTKGVFDSSIKVLPQTMEIESKQREKLDRRLQQLQENPESLLNVGGSVAHYMPDHATGMASTASNAVNFLNSLRPKLGKKLPLDTDPKAAPHQQKPYDKALDIAQKPLLVMQSIKDGSITPHEIMVLKTLYPSLYQHMGNKLSQAMVDHLAKGNTIPYKTRMGLSMFLGQPLDSTMTPQAIQSAQHVLMGSQPQQPQAAPQQHAKHSMNALNKLPGMYQTPGQQRQAEKGSKL